MRKILSFLCILFVISAFSQPPTNPTTSVNIYNIEGNRASISITRGNGTSRIVVIKKDSPVTFLPINGNSYLANTVFGNGQQVAPGEYIIMSSGSNNVTVTNLIPSSTYHIAIFEFNGSGLSSTYLVSPNFVSSFITLSSPTTQATNAAISNLNSNTLTLSWTPGDGQYSMVLAKEGAPVNANPVDLISYYAQNTYYQISNGPAQIGVGNFVLYKGTGSSVNIDNLNPNTTYHFAVFTFNGSAAPVYLTTNPAITSATTLSYPTVQVSGLLFDTFEGDGFRARWTAGNGAGRIAIIREGQPVSVFPQDGTVYSGNANFINAIDIGEGHKVVYNGVGTNVTITNLVSGSTYYVAVFEYAGSGSARTYNIINYPTEIQGPAIAPTQNVVSISANNLTQSQATLTMQPGNGSGRFVVVRANAPTSYEPEDLNSYYANNTPNLNDNSGDVGNGNEVVYKGTGNQFTITNALPNTTYYVSAYEFNGNNKPIYNKITPAVTTFTTLLPPAPTIASSNLSFNSIEGNSFRLQWTNGNSERRLILMSKIAPLTFEPINGNQYPANTDFALANEIISGEKIVYDGTGSNTTITNLEIGTLYYVRIYDYNGTGSLSNYLIPSSLNGSGSTASAPTISSNNMYVEQISQDQLRVYWTNGNGQRKLLIGRLNEAVDAVPEDLIAYNASTYFNSGSEIAPGQRAKYFFTGAALGQESFATIYSVSPGNTYHFKLFEANGVNAPVYNTVNAASISYTIGYEPLTPSANMFTQSHDGGSMTAYIGDTGGGQRRIIVAREGSPVTFIPQDGVDYDANPDFSLGTDLGDGQKVVYDNASYFVNVTGLEHSTTYYFAVFEYGGTGSNIDYLTSSFATASGSTLPIPSQQATSISFNGTTSLSSNISWTNGDGTNRLVIARKNNPVDVEPVDYTNYNSYSSTFGSSGGLGNGNYVVFKNNSNNFNLTGLQSGTTYHLAVHEFNGSGTPVYLKPGLTGSFTTLGPPQEQAQLQAFSNITTNSGQINCIAGSGQKRLIVMKAGSPITAIPNENTTYVPNSYLGSGNSIGDDTFVVYNGFDSQVTVTGLAQGVTYYVAVFEFNSFSGGIVNYLTPSTALGNFTTIVDPCFGVSCPPGQECYEGGCFALIYTVSGIVRDAVTLLPLENVAVTNGIDTVFTDSTGNYSIGIEYGLSLSLSVSGYQTLISDPIYTHTPSFDLVMYDVCYGVTCPPGSDCYEGGCFPINYQVSGIVRDGVTLLPLPNVTVNSGWEIVTTDEQGYYSISVPYEFPLNLSASGYENLQTVPITGDSSSFDLVMYDVCYGVTCPPGQSCYDGGCFPISYEISGIVRDGVSLLPLANVTVNSGWDIVTTDEQGYYLINGFYGDVLTLSLSGYENLQSEPITGSTTSFDLYMFDLCYGASCPPGQTCYDGGCFPISYEISGIVRDGVSLLPLANVTVNSGWDIVTTDAQGYYLINGFYGDVLTLSLPGYENLQSEPITGSTTSFDLYMFDLCYGASCPPGQICYDGGCFPIENPCDAIPPILFTWYADSDGDGFGEDTDALMNCEQPEGYVAIGGDCDDTNNTVYPGAAEICYDGLDNDCDGIIDNGCTPIVSVVQPAQCGITLPTIDSYVYANLVAGAQGYRFRVTNLSTNEVQTIDRALRVFRMTQLTNYAFNTTYSIEVSVRINNVWQPFYGTPCSVSTPDTTTQIQASQCNTVISNVNNAIFADIVPFATGYRFRVTNTLNPIDVQTIDRPIRDFRMNLLSNIQYNTTYNVEVSVRNTDGTYLSYGSTCNITTPIFPTVGLVDVQCDEYLVTSNTEALLAESYTVAEGYRFLLENSSLPYSQTVDRATRTVTLNNFTGLLPVEMYTVRVAIQLNGIWGPYGKSCTIITPGAGRPDEVTRMDAITIDFDGFKAIALPNPFATSFAIDVKTSKNEQVSLTIYDMMGRLLEATQLKAQDVINYQFGDRYPSGVYNVVVTQGEETRTVRVVKQ